MWLPRQCNKHFLYQTLFVLMALWTSSARGASSLVEMATPEGKLILGVTQPDGSIFYLEKGMKALTEKIRATLIARTIPGSFVQMMADNAELQGSSFQLGRHLIPETIVPKPLRTIGIDLTHFLLPDEQFTPKQFLLLYEKLKQTPSDDAPLKNTSPFKPRVNKIIQELSYLDFMKIGQLYECTYNLSVFKVVRDSLKRDQLYNIANAALKWSFNFAQIELFMFTRVGVRHFWQTILTQKQWASLAATLSYLITFSYIKKMEDSIAERDLPDDIEQLNHFLALETYGNSGLMFLDDNTKGYAEIRNQTGFGSLSIFLNDLDIFKYLMNPTNYYDLKAMNQNLQKIDLEWLNLLKQQNPKAKEKLLIALAKNGNELTLNKLREAINWGSKSALWCELALLALKSDPSMSVYVDETAEVFKTAHTNKGEIAISKTDFFYSGRMAAVLGHEFWHRSKISYRDAEIFRYYNLNEYSRAYAAEEMIAILAEQQIVAEIMKKTNDLPQRLEDEIEHLNPTKFETVLNFMSPDSLRDFMAFLFQHGRSQHWNSWREND